MAPPPQRARRFTLQGRTFAFHGIAHQSRQQWTRVLEARGATVRADWRGHAAPAVDAAAQVFVLTDWWVDSLPHIASNVFCVTEFWLRESLKAGGWLALDAHPFFTPPAAAASAPLLLSYPMDYDDGALTPVTTRAITTLAQLPCSPLNLYEDVVPLWPYIVVYLRSPTTTTAELAAVLKLITGEARHPLNCLRTAIDELLSPIDHKAFFRSVLPAMKQLVLDLPFTFRKSFQLLPPLESDSAASGSRSLHDKSVNLTRGQLLPLLSAMFLSVFPAQAHIPNVEFPWFSMESMFSAPRSMPDFVLLKAQKIRTILEYFLRIVPRYLQAPDELEREIVTFTRVALDAPSPSSDHASLLQSLALGPTATGQVTDVQIETNSLIEDLEAHLQIDFANKYAGGGVMNGGAVQEEIRFILSPELMVACLVFARLEANESFVIHGSERFSNYTGYGGTFRFAGSVQDATPFETIVVDAQTQQPKRRRQSVVVGIDAISYGGNDVNRQYSRRSVMRELTKALVGFAYPNTTTTAWPIATGNWGCGVFRGDPELKFLIQWVAASLAGRPMVYVIFEQTDLQDKITGLLRECTRVVGTQPQHFPQKLLDWIVAFLLELESESIGHADRTGPVRGSTRNEGPRGQDERMRAAMTRRRPSGTVLERAIAFVRGKAIPTSTAHTASDDSATTGALSTSSAPTSPAPDPVASSTQAPRPPTPVRTPVSTPRHRTSGSANGSGGGPQLKQPKLTSFWK